MSLFDSASLVVTPNGYKEDKLYSIKPTDGSGDLVVTRATTATRVNSEGLIEQVPYNLVTYSNTFSNSDWIKSDMNFTSGQSDPFGSTNAWRYLTLNASNGYAYQGGVTKNGQMTLSFWVKSNTSSNQTFVMTANSGTQSSPTITANSTWQRVTWSFTSSGTGSNVLIAYNGTSILDLLIYGFQAEQGTSAKEYFPTTDRLDVPRLDYTNSSCPSILVEPQRTNLILRSQEFDNAVWTKANTTISANNATSPDGTQNADKLIVDNGASLSSISNFALQSITKSASSIQYTYSTFVKQNGLNRINIVAQGASIVNNASATFSLVDGSIAVAAASAGGFSGASASVINYENGWYRCNLVFTTNTDTDLIIRNIPTDSNLTVGNGTNGILIWGAQLEVGSYATSYVPTVASSVTRNADVISKTGLITNNFLSATGGTWFVDLSDIQYISGAISFYIGDGGSNLLTFGGDFATKYLRVWLYNSGTSTNLYSFPFAQRQKIAFSFTLSQLKIFVNGVLVVTRNASLNCNLWTNFLNDNTSFSCRQNSMMFFNTQLTDAECIELTTI